MKTPGKKQLIGIFFILLLSVILLSLIPVRGLRDTQEQTLPKVEIEPQPTAPPLVMPLPEKIAPFQKEPEAIVPVAEPLSIPEIFNLYIVHTGSVLGRVEEGEGIGYPKLASLINQGRILSENNLLLLDAGNVSSGTALAEMNQGETMGVLLDMLGYDAVVPQAADFVYGSDRLLEAAKLSAENSTVKVLSANVLDSQDRMMFQPYQLYGFKNFTIGVIGVTEPIEGIQEWSFIDDAALDNAQSLVDEVREQADFVVVLGRAGMGDGITGGVIAKEIRGIDLLVDAGMPQIPSNGLRVGDTLIVSTDACMKSVGVVEIQVRDGRAVSVTAVRIDHAEVENPETSVLAAWAKIPDIVADEKVQTYIDSQKALLARLSEQPEPLSVVEPAIEPEPHPLMEPLVPSEPVVEPVAVPEPIAVVEPVAVPEPIAVVEPVAVPEPIAVVEPVAVPEPIAVVEPVAVPEPIAVVEPVAVPEPIAVVEPVAVPKPIAVVEPVVVPKPIAVVEPVVVPESIPMVESLEEDGAPVGEEADPWADFYVGGEEDLSIFEEGSYYVPLFVNDEYIGDINMLFTENQLLVDAKELRSFVGDLLIDSVRQDLFGVEQEWIGLARLNETGIDAWYDYQMFELHMTFPTWMMPLRFLSVNSSYLSRYSSYGMTGTNNLDPAFFSWFTNLSVYSVVDFENNPSTGWALDKQNLFNLQASNSLSIGGVAIDFSYNLGSQDAMTGGVWSTNFDDYFDFLGYQGFYDFEDESLRFLFGNVNDYLGYSTDKFGFALEKRYAYGTKTAKGHQYQYEVVLDEPATVEVFINEHSVYRRELQAGTYRLKDFIFTQGANIAKVVVAPLSNPDAFVEYYFSLGYDSSLMSKGDSLYSISLTFPNYTASELFSRISSGEYADLGEDIAENLASFTMRLSQQTGMTDIFTGSYDAALRKDSMHLGLSGILALTWGTFQGSVYTSIRKDLGIGMLSELGYRVSGTEGSLFNTLEFSFSYESANYTSSMDTDTQLTSSSGDVLSGTVSFSGKAGKSVRYSFSGSAFWMPSDGSFTWSATVSSGFSLAKNLSVSGSFSLLSQTDTSTPQIRGHVGMSYSFTPNLSVSASSDLSNSSYATASWKPGGSSNDSFQLSLSGLDFTSLDTIAGSQGTLSYTHSAKLYGLSLRQQYAEGFDQLTTTLSLGTSFAYANGMVGMARNISDNFLLVKPEGALVGGGVAVTRTMSSQPDELSTVFGVGTYTAITPHQKNNVVIYGTGDSLLGTGGSYVYDFTPRTHQGFTVRVTAERTYTVVSTLLKTPASAYARYTAGIAKVERAESGEEYLVDDDSLYLFTDENGFFFLSGLAVGQYEFDLFLPEGEEDDPPLRIRFQVEEPSGKDRGAMVFVMEAFVASEVEAALNEEAYQRMAADEEDVSVSTGSGVLDHDGTYHLKLEQTLGEMEFWDEYYPTRTLLNTVEKTSVASSDAIVEIRQGVSADALSAFQKMRETGDERLAGLARLRADLIENLDRIMPDMDNPTVLTRLNP